MIITYYIYYIQRYNICTQEQVRTKLIYENILTVFVCMHRTSGVLINPNLENPDEPEPEFDLEGLEFCYCAQLIRSVYQYYVTHICQECFDNLDPEEQDECEVPPTHVLCGEPALIQIFYCGTCEIHLAELRPAISCFRCMLVFNNLEPLEREYLSQGMILRTVEL